MGYMDCVACQHGNHDCCLGWSDWCECACYADVPTADLPERVERHIRAVRDTLTSLYLKAYLLERELQLRFVPPCAYDREAR